MDETTVTLALDLAVLATSGAAVLYCGQLARRLGRLRDAEGGTPRALAELARAIDANRESASEIAEAARAATAEMRGAFADLTRQQQMAEDLAGTLDGQAALAERRMAAAQAATEAALTAVTRRAGIELEALSRAVEIAAGARATEAASEAAPAKAAPGPTGKPEALPADDAAPVRQRASAEPNPFLRAVG